MNKYHTTSVFIRRVLTTLALLVALLIPSASPFIGTAYASSSLNILTVGPNYGNRATENYVPTIGSPLSGVDHIGSTVTHVNETAFNALTAADLAAYHVVLTQWGSSGTLDLTSQKVKDYIYNGGGLILDGDYSNYNDLSWVGITGALTGCSGSSTNWTFTIAADPVLTNALPANPNLANCHGRFPNFDSSVFVVFLKDNSGQNAGLAGSYGSGRIIVTGPDHDYHSLSTSQQYQLLLNELEWVTLNPKAVTGGPYNGNEGSTINIDGSGSSDPDGDALTYTWSYTAGAGVDLGASCLFGDANAASTTITCDDDGTYNLQLSVSDGQASNSASTIVTVGNVAPTATFGNDGPVDEGSSFTLSLSSPSDPSSADTAAGFEYAFDCGDGAGYGAFGTASSAACATDDNGTRAVRAQIRDKDGGVSAYTGSVAVNNVAPTATFGSDGPVDEGSSFTLSLSSPSDPSSADTTAGFEYAFDCGDGAGYGPFATASSAACATDDNGTRAVRAQIRDKDGGVREYTGSVAVDNVAPTATFGNDSPVDEGSSFTLSLSAPSDPSSADTTAGFEYAFDCGDGAGYGPFATASSATCATDDNGSRAVQAQIRDKDGGVREYTASVAVDNVAPEVGPISVDLPLVPVNTQITASAVFTDPGTADTHTADWSWGDGSTSQTTGASPAAGSHSYAEPGVYTVALTVTDDDGGADSVSYEYVVVYDPSAGFVTGGGWILSPAGAYAADPDLTGRANFGFVSRYRKGATTPTGQTEFQFKAGDLNFHSSTYEWLVIAGANAKFKGTGTINGGGNYGFMLTATDADIDGGGSADAFRIKIWDIDNGDAVVYDNQMGAADDGTAATELGGGSIKIHKK